MWKRILCLAADTSTNRPPLDERAAESHGTYDADAPYAERAAGLFSAAMHRIYVDCDRIFAGLMLLQWLAGIVIALVVSPYTWIGEQSRIHEHVIATVFLGAAISSLPLLLVWRCPGQAITRHVVAAAQMLWSALLIHLTGGRIETHFHVFVSLAFLALYRDWHVLITATIVVALDHAVRGVFWPLSVFGVSVESPFRWIEHAVWVVFEDIILIRSCFLGLKKTWGIAEREAKLSITNRDLEAQIAERHKAEAEVRRVYDDLAAAHEEALAASQVKSQFLANMSHELRTPLNAILGYSELLKLSAAKRNETRDVADLDRIHKSGTHLLALINDILDISKIEAGKMTLEMQDCAIGSILDDVRETIRPLALQNKNEFEMRVDHDIGLLRADAIRLKQCLLNILSNACKFTRSGRVVFTVTREASGADEAVRFEVADTGVGLSEEQIGKLFQPFTQADSSTTRKFGGTGLGLAITKKLVEAMGGGISVTSRVGAGSTFTIEMPSMSSPAALALPQMIRGR
jgi:two-component system sensor histidine kinase/response regulator